LQFLRNPACSWPPRPIISELDNRRHIAFQSAYPKRKPARAKSELKNLIPEDAKEAIGHGVRAKRSRSGAVSFDVLDTEASRASIQ